MNMVPMKKDRMQHMLKNGGLGIEKLKERKKTQVKKEPFKRSLERFFIFIAEY